MTRIVVVLTALIVIRASVYPEIWTNTILSRPFHVKSMDIVRFSRTGAPNLLFTRRITGEDGRKYYYYIDVNTLSYGITDSLPSGNDCLPDEKSLLMRVFSYQKEKAAPFGLQAEIASSQKNGRIVLTSDLCPTTNRFDKLFYTAISSVQTNIPVPLLIFFTGKWMDNHPEALSEIRNSGIAFIAGNHSYNHRVLKTEWAPAELTAEITNTEKDLLAKGILPSFYFRFPAFSHRPGDLKNITELSMVALDANNWMGCTQRDGEILLVHSNGVVSVEVRMWANYLRDHRRELSEKKIVFIDIGDYLKRKFEKNRL